MNEQDYMPISEMKDGYTYRIDARNASFGVWEPVSRSFKIRRQKFTDIFIDTEDHWDNGAPYGTAKPLEEIEKGPEPDEDLLKYLTELTE
jgi:hypothetical protein